MNAAFSFPNYVIKHRNPLAWGRKYVVLDPQKQPVLYVEYKTHLRAPHITYGIFADPEHMQNVLTIEESKSDEYPDFFDVTDSASGEKVGSVGLNWESWIKDSWGIADPQGKVVAQVKESSAGRAIMHELTDGVVKQKIDIVAGDTVVATLRQKSALIGHHLVADFSMDAAGTLDRRLGLMAAIMVATHQGATETT